MVKMKETGPNGLTDDQLSEALFKIEDTFQRMLCPFFLLGETAQSIRDSYVGSEKLTGRKIEIGVQRKYLTKEALITLDSYETGKEKTGFGFKLLFKDIPIEVRIIERKYSFLKNLDKRFYRTSEYLLPNPFEAYWKVRGIIR